MFRLGIPELIIVAIIFIFTVLPIWKICSKTGYPGALSLLLLLPFINICFFFFLAFVEWPIEKELKQLKGINK